MVIDPKTVDIREHWKGWMRDAFSLFKKGILTHIISLATVSLVYYTIIKLIDNKYIDILVSSTVLPVLCIFLFYQFFGICYKKDSTPPPYDIQLTSRKIYQAIRLISGIILFLASVLIVPIGIAYIINGMEPFESSTVPSSEHVFVFANAIEKTSETFSTLFLLPFDIAYMLILFLNLQIKESVVLMIKGMISRNMPVLVMLMLFHMIVEMIVDIEPQSMSFLLLLLTPYFSCLCYVISKHIFFDIEPNKVKKESRATVNSMT